ncbi:MAG: adaptor protein MecA [Lachnospiraceae bacterium]|nr:adaptor protein MecA [Lachnospiraceae bacterium]MBQ9563171.1 adaptor protein MecA [Lachnospiraceae bacterium]MBR0152150.1 adaptor protein MecA [Lachnospiraceae bacterium]
MKIEKISENQIRCTLSKKDLADRHIGLKDLAYGAPQTRELFKEMMEQAFTEFGFDAEDIPVMVEAMPLAGESLVLVITKIDNPDELDARFSRFTPSPGPSSPEEEAAAAPMADEILHAFNQLHDLLRGVPTEPGKEPGPSSPEEEAAQMRSEAAEVFTRIYAFTSLEEVIRMSAVLHPFYHGANSLYKDEKGGRYYLIAEKSGHTPEEFNKFCNMMTEYAEPLSAGPAAKESILEHCEPVIEADAIKVLYRM